ncbi:ThiF family adenylyltransferase [Dactylosporangium aurantiacum]|uniref:ThiF family adenylyltransferase n=1 Tax=Dactylosporangium aurantiacum TaxID=35754 RepID=A0A9Q9ICL4_9ACTN|nr:ThiF family adenylyltransferase [Dactylosporangium aurantiacum]MDG6101415.1 ThiF family adenylyltransferase [Dactylosporangium aurantiacum]UWZ52731.1 ThiF family adenylyltransferase [Dactylosporangium aurantiacum]
MTGTGQRFVRHALIPGWDQRSLAGSSVVIVGVGAVGSEVARLLALAGVGRLLLCDPDTVEESNLSRGALYGPADVGRGKAEAAAAALRHRDPATAVTARTADFRHGVGLAELRAADAVLCCLDSVADRIALASRCGLVGAGLLDAGTYPWGGEVRYYPPGGACFACGCSPAERSLTAWHVTCADPPAHAGASGPVSALTAAWQSVTAVRLLFGLPVPAGAVRLDPVSGLSQPVGLRADPACPCHERLDPARITLAGFGPAGTVADLLALVQPGEHALAWQPIVPGDPLAPMTIAAADPRATLAELGIPPGEILPVVRPPDEVRYLELQREAPA